LVSNRAFRTNYGRQRTGGDGHRNGAVRMRLQLKTKVTGEDRFTKRDKTSGQFMDQKEDRKKFKGVRKEH
jgi:hypothetical protein